MSTSANAQYGGHTTVVGGSPPASGGGLPFTGFDVGLPVVVGLAMIVGGIVARRSTRTT